MKTLTCLLLLLGVLLAAGCNSTTSPISTSSVPPSTTSPGSAPVSTVSPGALFVLAPGAGVALTGSDLTIRFLDVTGDSRCAQGVTCVQAGWATARVEFTTAGGTETVSLKDTGGVSSLTETTYRDYKLSFRVMPYPVAGQSTTAEDYRLEMTITR
jgi:hypothetical protein